MYFIPCGKHKLYDIMEPKRRNLIQPHRMGEIREIAIEVWVMSVGQGKKKNI